MKVDDFAQLLTGVGELVRYSQGKAVTGLRVHQVEPPDIKQVRESVRVTQTEFAHLIGVNVRTLQNWEQKRSRPRGAAHALLRLVASDPKRALRTLAG